MLVHILCINTQFNYHNISTKHTKLGVKLPLVNCRMLQVFNTFFHAFVCPVNFVIPYDKIWHQNLLNREQDAG